MNGGGLGKGAGTGPPAAAGIGTGAGTGAEAGAVRQTHETCCACNKGDFLWDFLH